EEITTHGQYGEDPETALIRKEEQLGMAIVAHAALEQMPPRDRLIVSMAAEGATQSQIAAALGVNQSTISRALLHKRWGVRAGGIVDAIPRAPTTSRKVATRNRRSDGYQHSTSQAL